MDAARLGVLVAELAALIDALRTEINALENAADAGPASPGEYTDQSSMEAVLTLQLLHPSDMDSSTGALANVKKFSAILDGFRQQYPDNTIVLARETTTYQGRVTSLLPTKPIVRCSACRVTGAGTLPS